jgi:hypothetical protein
MRNGSFAAIYAGRYVEGERNIVLVTEQPQAVQSFLVREGVPPSAFEVRLVNATLDRLHRAEAAGLRWLEQFSGGGAVTINIPTNRVIISVERQPLVKISRLLAPLATATTLIAADHTVYHDEEHPSALILPIKS